MARSRPRPKKPETRLTGSSEPLSHPSPGQTDFSVKVPVRAGDATHYLWLLQIAFDGSNFSGILGPDADGLKGHFPGERITIASREIADWMFVDDGRLAGGFSLRAIRERLRGKARTQFEKSMWFRFE